MISPQSRTQSPSWRPTAGKEGVSNSLREHASTAILFASTSSDQICLASSEYFRKYNWRAASKFQLPYLRSAFTHNHKLGKKYLCIRRHRPLDISLVRKCRQHEIKEEYLWPWCDWNPRSPGLKGALSWRVCSMLVKPTQIFDKEPLF